MIVDIIIFLWISLMSFLIGYKIGKKQGLLIRIEELMDTMERKKE